MNSSSDRKTNLRYGAIARATDAAELALALKLIGELREGSPIELGGLAELLGPRAPGKKCAGGPGQRGATNAPASQGHLDAILRALPKLAQDRIIVFHSPLTLDPAGHAVGGTRDRMPSWEFEPTLETAGRPPRSEQAIRFAEQVERAALGYTITADASRLAVAADASGRITGTLGELAKTTARSKDATQRTLEELAQRGFISKSTTGKRPIIFNVVLGGSAEGEVAQAPARSETASAAADTPAPAPAAVSVPSPPAPAPAPQPAATLEAAAKPAVHDFAIEIAPRELCYPQLRDEMKRVIEKRRAKVEFNKEFDVEEMSPAAAAEFDELVGKLEYSCWWQEDFVHDLLQTAVKQLIDRDGDLRLFYEPMRTWKYLQGVMRNRAKELVAKKRERFGEMTRDEIRAAMDAQIAHAEAKQLLRECASLQRREGASHPDALEILESRLLPLAPRVAAGEFDGDVAWAEASIREAFKQGTSALSRETEPDEWASDYLPEWSWPTDVPTWKEREAEIRKRHAFERGLTTLGWQGRVVEALDEFDGVAARSDDAFAAWLRTEAARDPLARALELSPYEQHQEAWDRLLSFAGLDRDALLGKAA